MTKKETEGQEYSPYGQFGEAPTPEQQAQAMHYYGYPPHMMHPHQMGHMPPPAHMHPHYQGHPHMHPGAMPPPSMGYMHPHMHPHMAHHMAHPEYAHMHPGMHPGMAPQEEMQSEPNPLFEQAQAMLEGALGEEAGMFKELLGTVGMNDKEFWKGAMVGAAAALVLSNENVRKGLMNVISGAGNMLKTGGEQVKDTATQTAAAVQQNVSAGNEIFRDTYAAGKEGFQQSVERHKQEKMSEEVEQPQQFDGDAPQEK
ncbi:hypothetical protein [Photobacterium jeanii]|uniref:hypothetical protein n=1 Tax=Photobacterium jeanii TaxID=858640 RepID=UPI0009FEF28B|nr:hypothetical protein [Photobacterium jeanii]